MVTVLIIAHSEIANSFAYCLEHILNKRVENLVVLPVKKAEEPESIMQRAKKLILNEQEKMHDVLILSDIFGATPGNIAQKLIIPNQVELISGLNLPMLIRAVSYCHEPLSECLNKALVGGKEGIIHVKGDLDAK